MTEVDIRDIAIRIVDRLVEEEYIPDCTGTESTIEFDIQEIIEEVLRETLLQV